MSTRGEWARDLARALGNNNPSRDTIQWIAAWTKGENTKARFNPLATTYNNGDNTKFNSVGVRNYKTRQDGITATVTTLRMPYAGYADIAEGIRTNNPTRAQRGLAASPWGTNAGNVANIYKSGDVSAEPLLSEDTTLTSFDAQPSERIAVQSVSVSPDSVKRVLYVVFGAVLVFGGGSLIVRRYIPTVGVSISA